MKKVLFAFIIVLFCGATTARADNVSFTVSAPRVVSEGEAFRITFSVNADADEFTPPDFSEFTVIAGPSRSTSQSFQIINGQTSHSKSITYTYVMQANKVGKANLGAASVVVDGATYQTQPATIEVVAGDSAQQPQQGGQVAAPAGNNADVFVRVLLSKSNVYRGEHLIATIKLYTQTDIAGFEDVKFPTFNGFWSQELEAPQQLNFQRENVNGKIYHTAVMRRYVLFPQQTGSLAIEPFEVTCAIQTRSASRSLFDDFFSAPQVARKRIASPAGTVNVTPLPANAPASFAGAVGAGFKLSASFTRDSITANDASSLLIKISGDGNLKLMDAPKVTWPPDFETYDVKVTDNSKASAAGMSGTKQFEIPFIPRSAGNFTLPALAFTYFDIAKKQYITLTSQPLEVKVGRDPNASGATAVVGVNRQAIKSVGEDIRYIKTAPPKWREKGKVFFGTTAYYLLIGLEALLFIAAYLYLLKHRKESQNVVLVRNKKANKIARKRLNIADRLLKSGSEAGFYEELTKALWGYLGDKLAIAVADLSRENIRETLQARQLPDTDTELFLQVLDECEFARYAPAGGQVQRQKIYNEAINTISRLEQHLK